MIYDYVILGAGVIGTSTAYHLKQKQLSANVLIIDQFERAGLGSTSKSAALYRDLFGSSMSQQLASSSIDFYKEIANRISLNPMGYWWMLPDDNLKKKSSILELLSKKSNTFEILDLPDLTPSIQINAAGSQNFPGISKVLYGNNCGALSAVKLARYYAKKFQKLGGTIAYSTQIKKFTLKNAEISNPPWKPNHIVDAVDASNKRYRARKFISAVGGWTGDLLAPIGIASGIYPKKRQIFALKIENFDNFISTQGKVSINVPVIILPAGGVYIKPLIGQKMLIVGCADHLGSPFFMDDFPPTADRKYFHDAIEPVLNHYFPNLKAYSISSSWAGYYSYYWPDANPVIEQSSNLIWVGGTSGSGIMKADSIGRIVASKATASEFSTLYDGTRIKVSDLSLKTRKVESENFVI